MDGLVVQFSPSGVLRAGPGGRQPQRYPPGIVRFTLFLADYSETSVAGKGTSPHNRVGWGWGARGPRITRMDANEEEARDERRWKRTLGGWFRRGVVPGSWSLVPGSGFRVAASGSRATASGSLVCSLCCLCVRMHVLGFRLGGGPAIRGHCGALCAAATGGQARVGHGGDVAVGQGGPAPTVLGIGQGAWSSRPPRYPGETGETAVCCGCGWAGAQDIVDRSRRDWQPDRRNSIFSGSWRL